MPVREVLYEMERDGVMLDAGCFLRKAASSAARSWLLEQQAFQLAGQPFNLASPKQLGEILFDKMKLPTVRKTATGSRPPTRMC
jgi:DNA polymerase-1